MWSDTAGWGTWNLCQRCTVGVRSCAVGWALPGSGTDLAGLHSRRRGGQYQDTTKNRRLSTACGLAMSRYRACGDRVLEIALDSISSDCIKLAWRGGWFLCLNAKLNSSIYPLQGL